MNVLITSGGTSEKIDSVRSISNISTGKLGSLLALNFSEQPDIKKIYYICSNLAIKPQSEKIEIIIANNVSDVEISIKNLLDSTDIDIIVHSMAISDYYVKNVTSTNNLIEEIIFKLDVQNQLDSQSIKSLITSSLREPKMAINRSNKISSDLEDIIVYMEKTPKIIKHFHLISPKSILVGFKLLDNVPLESLIESGYKILTENKCNFVLVNDLKDIKDKQHIGYLIDENKKYIQYSNKTKIAEAIVTATINERRKEI